MARTDAAAADRSRSRASPQVARARAGSSIAIYVDDKIKRLHRRPRARDARPERRTASTSAACIDYGASPRASIYLALAAKAHAFLQRPRLRHAAGRQVDRHGRAAPPRAHDLRGRGRGVDRRGRDPAGLRRRAGPLSRRGAMLRVEALRQVRRIQIRTRRLVDGVFAGEYHTVFKGRGMEFDEVREYVPGDDVRTIDWNVTARMGQPYVKRFVEERELTVMLLVDLSASGRLRQRRQAQDRDRGRAVRVARAQRDPQQRQGRPDPVHRPGRALRAAAEGQEPGAARDPRDARLRARAARHRSRPRRSSICTGSAGGARSRFLLSDFLASGYERRAPARPPAPRHDPGLHLRPARGRACPTSA